MKCLTTYARYNADTIQGERLVVSHTYTTFDSIEMDAFEKHIRDIFGSGIMMEFEYKEGADHEEDGEEW